MQLYGKLQDLKQDSKTVQGYTESFYRLHCNLPESEEVRIRRYLHGLRGDIRYDLVHVRIVTLEETYSFASESEKKMSYMSSYRATLIGPKIIVKCYSCGQEGHVQANCRKKPVLTIDMESPQLETNDEAYRDTSEGIFTPADTGFPMLLPHVSPVHESARGNVFQQSATLYNPLASKTCPAYVVLDNGSSISLISGCMVDTLGLTTMVHRRPTKVHSFRVGDFEELAEAVRVGVRMRDFSDYILCHIYRLSQGRCVFTLRNQPLHKMSSPQIVLAKVGKDAYLLSHRRSNTISPLPATFSAAPIEEGIPGLADDEKLLQNSTPSASPLFDGPILHSPSSSPPQKLAPVPQTIEVLVPSIAPSPPVVVPSNKSAPMAQTVPELIPPTPQSVSQKTAPDIQIPVTAPHALVPVASPPIDIPVKSLPVQPSKPGIAPSAVPVPIASPPIDIPEKPLPVQPSKPGIAPSAVSGIPLKPLPSAVSVPVASPPIDIPVKSLPAQPSKPGIAPFAVPVPVASPPIDIPEQPLPVQPSKPGVAPSAVSVPVASPPIDIPVNPLPVQPSKPGIVPSTVSVPVASPPLDITEKPLPVQPFKPGIAPSAVSVPVASPPIDIPEKPLPVQPSKPGIAPTVQEHSVFPMSTPPPSISGKQYGIPVAAPPKDTSSQSSPVNHPPTKEHGVSPVESPPRTIPEEPVVMHPSKPGVAPSPLSVHAERPTSPPPPSTVNKKYGEPVAAPPMEKSNRFTPVNQPPIREHVVSPMSPPPPSTSNKENGVPVAAPPKEISSRFSPVNHHPVKDHAVSPMPTPPPITTRKEFRMPSAPPLKKTFHQSSPMSHSPTKEHVVSPISSPPPSTSKKEYGMPASAPPKQRFDQLSPMNHPPAKDHPPTLAPAPYKAVRPSNIVPAPSVVSPKHDKKKLLRSPASLPPISSNKRHHRGEGLTPALAPSNSVVPPSYNNQGPLIPHAPSHPPSVAPKRSRLRHHYPPPMTHGPVSPVQPPSPSTVAEDSPAPTPSSAIPSAQTKSPVRPPLSAPLASPPMKPKMSLLPPPPPNQDCTSLACLEPLTNSPPGAPCGCVLPIKVGLRLGVALYTFFPLVSELAEEIAAGVFMKQSQVRIMGANAAAQELEKTDVLINLVPLGERFDNTAAFLTYEKLWHKQVALKTSFFGDYEVLYVSYPGLPPSPPSAPSSITVIDGVPYRNGNNARAIHPLGVDVRRKREGGLGGSIIAIIVLSSFAALVLCAGAAWLLVLKCGNHSHLAGKTPRSSIRSIAKQSGAGGSTMFGSGISSTSLSFAEVEMLSRLHHRNLVKLIGICTEDSSRCLVYELIPNGSVESHLHGVDKEIAPLDWGSRTKIALGAARGLAYLHEDSSPHVIHRDFKSSNILLEHDFTPKVSDFGLARTALDEGSNHISTRVMGTFGKEGLEMIIDPSLGSNFPFDSVAKVAAIASMCVQPEVSHRPFMGEVVQALKLVCNECDETKEAGSESSQEYMSVVDIDIRTSNGSGHLLETSHAHCSDYDSSLEVGRALSASDILSTSRRLGRQSSESFRRHSSSGPLRTGKRRQFWQRVRGPSRGSVSEHGAVFRLWGGSH
ncbi:hypothetical protein IFM89_015688 [Coptis chinensis]|uniref:non-specific serine/threonine protein kinase n=1 Tax=Coptis chinensis TaxID=261450 RepID=A0A835I843_9MAGN|nr:hypothetical protein IFM89_015688 [Coptis chinensis]